MLSLLLVLACSGSSPEQAAAADPAPVPEGKARHAVLIVVDTLRADAVDRARTPALDRLAASGAQRGWAWSASTWTAPAIVSLFSGSHVRQHGWDFPFPDIMAQRDQDYPDLPQVPLLAEVLSAAGFRTRGLYANDLIGQGLGYERGFDTWDFAHDPAMPARVAEQVEGWSDDQRQFLYVHLFGPHHPLRPGRDSRSHWSLSATELGPDGKLRLPEVRAGGPLEEQTYWRAYHAVVEDTDRHLGELFEALGPHLDDTLVVVTADHGELIGEQGRFGHSMGVWEPLTRVPLVVKNGPLLPDRVSTAAVADLVTRGLGVEHTWPVDLASAPSLVAQREGAVALTIDGRTKAIWDERAYDGPVMLDLVADPGEEHPFTPVAPTLVQARSEFDGRVPEGHLEPKSTKMGDKMVEALRALGYVE